jgi:hypothetical protein
MRNGPTLWPRVGARIEHLPVEECVELLGARSVGRLAFVTPAGPRIVPLNFTVHLGAVWFSTGPQTEVARYGAAQQVAFEIDDVHDFLQAGWSVVAVGWLELFDGPPPSLTAAPFPEPWPADAFGWLGRLEWSTISGRRLHPS